MNLKISIAAITIALVLSGCTLATYEGGIYNFNRGDYKTAINIWKEAAEAGDYKAQLALAEVYSLGELVPQNFTEAARWYRLAAERGNLQAQARLGAMYITGLGVPKNPEEGIKWLTPSAENGDPVSQLFIGAAYYEGSGVAKNDIEAAKWLKLSADQGDLTAQAAMGRMYINGSGVPKDVKEGLRLITLSANQNNSAGATILGKLYAEGLVVPKSDKNAIKWLSIGAKGGNEKAIAILPEIKERHEKALSECVTTEEFKKYRLAAETAEAMLISTIAGESADREMSDNGNNAYYRSYDKAEEIYGSRSKELIDKYNSLYGDIKADSQKSDFLVNPCDI